MGKRGSSCLNIIYCAGDPVDSDDAEAQALQEKTSASRRKWIFRKRSNSRRPLGNQNVGNDPRSVVETNQNTAEDGRYLYPQPTYEPSPEKIPVVTFVEPAPEKIPVVTFVEPTPVPSVTSEPEISDTSFVDTSHSDSVIIIQCAIRTYLARKELVRFERIVKLQAVVRGHLIRRQAVCTLRCVQAIIKMQSLIRARLSSRQSIGKEVGKEGKEINYKKQITPHSSQKLLANGFACKLLESTPSKKLKVIHINCDSSKSVSAWKWLERWMAITSSDVPLQQETSPNVCIQEQEIEHIQVRSYTDDILTEDQNTHVSTVDYESVEVQNAKCPLHSVSGLDSKSKNPNKGFIDYSISCNGLEAPSSLSEIHISSEMKDQERLGDNDIMKEKFITSCSQLPVEVDANVEFDIASEKYTIDIEKSRCKTKGMNEQGEEVVKKNGCDLQKACNPAFAAVKSKFEEISSSARKSFGSQQENLEAQNSDTFTPNSNTFSKRENNSTDYQKLDRVIPQRDPLLKKEFCIAKDSSSSEIRHQTAASLCGTEISITSTLDSPDRSEVEGGEIVLEIGPLEGREYEMDYDSLNVINPLKSSSDDVNICTDDRISKEQVFMENNNWGLENRISAKLDPVYNNQASVKPAVSDISVKLDDSADQQIYKSLCEGSPGSHLTAAQSNGTPSSQVSVNTKKSKRHKKLPTGQRSFQLTSKKSLANENMKSYSNVKPEHLLKDDKNGKRRNSLGMAKPDHGDIEPRVCQSIPLPSYMQATESAKAKVHGNNSPKESQYVHEKERYSRKRHSLPIVNGKQEASPRMQRSSSQVQENSKANGLHSPHINSEKKWRR